MWGDKSFRSKKAALTHRSLDTWKNLGRGMLVGAVV